MGRDPFKRNQSLYCQYHQDRGHTIEDCRALRDHLDQLVKAGKLKQFMHQLWGQESQTRARYQREIATRPSLGTINMIFATPSCDASSFSGVMFVASKPKFEEQVQESKRVRSKIEEQVWESKWVRSKTLLTLGFSEEDKVRTPFLLGLMGETWFLERWLSYPCKQGTKWWRRTLLWLKLIPSTQLF